VLYDPDSSDIAFMGIDVDIAFLKELEVRRVKTARMM